MKTINFGINSFSDQMAEHQLSKFTRPEFLSKSNNFSDALKKTEEENKEKDKNTNRDLHVQKLIDKIERDLSVDGEKNIEDVAKIELQNSLFGIVDDSPATKDFTVQEDKGPVQKLNQNVKASLNKIEEPLSQALSKASEKEASDKLVKNKASIKLNDSFKMQDQNEKMNINPSQTLGDGRVKGQKQRLGGDISDLQSKNNLSLQKNLRSKNIDNRSKLGALKATQIYEKQQPVDSKKTENKIQSSDVQAVKAGKVKLEKTITPITKSNSDSLKNDLMTQQTSQIETSEADGIVGKDFSKALEMKSQFKAEGVDDIIQNAQLLANKGGGELKLLLNPRGLGSVQLKVMQEDGQLRVEMTTETKEAQEVIESSLGDLKKALADNNLDIESISIDSFNEINEVLQKEEELSQNEFAKDFLSEFKHENNAWRQGVLGFPSVRERKSQVLEQPEISSTRKVQSNRKLDLVA